MPLAIALAIGLISLVFIGTADYCSANAIQSECLTNWIGALSGWFATFAGGLTLFFLFRQIEEQRKQTDFLLGEARPELSIFVDIEDPRVLVLEIVNLNRRPLQIRAVALDSFECMIKNAKVDGEPRQVDVLPIFRPFLYMHGWLDRSSTPSIAKIRIVAVPDYMSTPLPHFPSGTEVQVVCVQTGDRYRSVELRAKLVVET